MAESNIGAPAHNRSGLAFQAGETIYYVTLGDDAAELLKPEEIETKADARFKLVKVAQTGLNLLQHADGKAPVNKFLTFDATKVGESFTFGDVVTVGKSQLEATAFFIKYINRSNRQNFDLFNIIFPGSPEDDSSYLYLIARKKAGGYDLVLANEGTKKVTDDEACFYFDRHNP